MKRLPLAVPFVLLSSLPLAAQAAVTVPGDNNGCQPGGAVLDGGMAAGAELLFEYDAETALLRVTVENASPVTSGVANPVITRLYFSAPEGLIDTATLVGQASTAGQAPDFRLAFAPTALEGTSATRENCFGAFNFRLAAPNTAGGIVHPLADTTWHSPATRVIGPVTFDIQLAGPGTGGLSAGAFAAAVSQATQVPVNAAVKFQGGGATDQTGVLASGNLCRTGVYLRGEPLLGASFDICVGGSGNCHACLLASFIEGPTQIGNMVVPIGIPLISSFRLGDFLFGVTELCMPVTVPNNPQLLGTTLHLANVTHPFGLESLFAFSEPYSFTVEQ